MLRSVAAVVLGYLVFGISAAALFRLAGVDPHQSASPAFTVFSIGYGIVFALMSGYVAAKFAPSRPMVHAGVVAVVIAIAAVVSLVALPEAIWTQMSALVLFAPSTLAGAALNKR